MQGHIRQRGKQQFRVHRRCRYGAGTALSELRQTLLGRAQAEGELSFLWRQALETEERRRETKAGFKTRKEAQAAMSKVLVAVEEHSYVTPTKLTVREYLLKEWLPAIEATIRPTTYRSYVQHVECHICPHIGSVKLEKLSGATINAPVCQARAEWQARWQDGAFGALHPPCARRPASSTEGRRQVGATDA